MKSWIFIFSCILFFDLSSCRKIESPKLTSYLSMIQYIQKDSSLSFLLSAINRVSYDTVLSSGGPYTFFMTPNSAFLEVGITLDTIKNWPTSYILTLLKFSTIIGEVHTENFAATTYTSSNFNNIQNDPLFYYSNLLNLKNLKYPENPLLKRSYYGAFINGIKIIMPNINTANGILHRLEKVLLPPTKTLRQEIHSRPDYSLTDYVITRVPSLFPVFDSDSIIVAEYRRFIPFKFKNITTFLAPNNEAWKSLGLINIDTINKIDTGLLKNILYAQFINGPFQGSPRFGSYLGGFIFRTYNPINDDYKFGSILNDGISITSSLTVKPKIIRENIAATNGILILTDQVRF